MYFRHFPVAMGHYLKWALEKNGHRVFSVGEFTGDKIPWGEQYRYPQYTFPPNIVVETYQNDLGAVVHQAEEMGFKPDLIIQMGDIRWLQGDVGIPQVIIATDPHAIDYREAVRQAALYVTMQKCYEYPEFLDKTLWMPYGYDPDIHYPEERENKYDIVFCGLMYDHREKFLNAMHQRGYRVFGKLGVVYDEYRERYAEGKMAFNWSSKEDLPARFWEALAMKKPLLTNITPDMKILEGLEEGKHYIGFDGLEDAIKKARYYLGHPEKLKEIAEAGHEWVKPHTWNARAELLIEQLYERKIL